MWFGSTTRAIAVGVVVVVIERQRDGEMEKRSVQAILYRVREPQEQEQRWPSITMHVRIRNRASNASLFCSTAHSALEKSGF
jgi:hypothetical protein